MIVSALAAAALYGAGAAIEQRQAAAAPQSAAGRPRLLLLLARQPLWLAGIAALAFLATWLIPQIELKQWSSAATQNNAPGAPVTAEALDPQEAGWDGLDD